MVMVMRLMMMPSNSVNEDSKVKQNVLLLKETNISKGSLFDDFEVIKKYKQNSPTDWASFSSCLINVLSLYIFSRSLSPKMCNQEAEINYRKKKIKLRFKS